MIRIPAYFTSAIRLLVKSLAQAVAALLCKASTKAQRVFKNSARQQAGIISQAQLSATHLLAAQATLHRVARVTSSSPTAAPILSTWLPATALIILRSMAPTG